MYMENPEHIKSRKSIYMSGFAPKNATGFYDIEAGNPDGINYYIVPENTTLFRGDIPLDENDPLSHMNGPVFFGQTEEVAREYGMPFRFITTQPLKLLALDKSMDKIYEVASNDNSPLEDKTVKEIIPEILEKNYGYVSGIRNSDNDADKTMTNYLCKTYNTGYALDFTKTDAGGMFHREIIICDKDSVQFVEKISITEDEVDAIREKQKMRRLEEDRIQSAKEARLKHKTNVRSKLSEDRGFTPFSLNFGDDSDEEEEMKPRLLNFGDDSDDEVVDGGKRKTTRKRKTKVRKIKTKRKGRTLKHKSGRGKTHRRTNKKNKKNKTNNHK